MPVRVLIVDDHAIIRQGLRAILEWDSEIRIIGEAPDGERALQMARKLCPDVVLMDLLMPVMDGIAATTAIRNELPDTEVLALTSVLDESLVVGAIQAGAIGYLLKDTEPAKLCKAIKAAADGQVQLSPAAAAMLMHRVKCPRSPETLTERETEVLRLIARGESNKEIAAHLFISETTVKTHVKNIMQKLGVPSRTQAALYAASVGLVSLALARQ
ncbi:MAG: two component transcriptional regulator, LuxR family [Acidobacteria bacterium]|nr:two component transcriptional regulator, LuxR family [Acidobacteriota bacterium]